jgi:hypothetical protein
MIVMPDGCTTITEVARSILEHIGEVFELRTTDLKQEERLKTYLGDVDIAQGVSVLEIGWYWSGEPYTRNLAVRHGELRHRFVPCLCGERS